MTTILKCRAKGGPANCANPNCPERKKFLASHNVSTANSVAVRRVHTSKLPSGWYQPSLLIPLPEDFDARRDLVRDPLDWDAINELMKKDSGVEDDLGI